MVSIRKAEALTTISRHTILISELCDALTLSRGVAKRRWGYFLRAESFYNVATKEMEYTDINHPSMKLHQQSHGESFLTIIQKRLSDAGLYILDEPEAALSPQRQLSLLIQMKEAVTAGAQFYHCKSFTDPARLPGS